MPRHMSFAKTIDQVRAGTKTVTRRRSWTTLRPGDIFCAVEKAMGLKSGEHVKRLGLFQVVDVYQLPLDAIDPTDVVREGFPEMSPAQFVDFFCDQFGGARQQIVTRIEFAPYEPPSLFVDDG